MKFILNLIPTLSFFIFYKYYNIFTASFILIITSFIVFLFSWILYNSINKNDLINLISVFVFGFLTLYYHNSNFIKWKISIIYLLISLIILINYFWMKNEFIKKIFKLKIKLSNNIWKQLSIYWSAFFLICSILNTYIILYLSEEIWIKFKVFGLTILILLASLINIIYIYYLKKNKKL